MEGYILLRDLLRIMVEENKIKNVVFLTNTFVHKFHDSNFVIGNYNNFVIHHLCTYMIE